MRLLVKGLGGERGRHAAAAWGSIATAAVGHHKTVRCKQRMSTSRDSQRSAVYAWERRLPGWPGECLTLGGCQQLLCEVWGEYLSSDAPLVTDGRGRRSACYAAEPHQVRLPRATRALFVVLHEAAHGILHQAAPEAAHHGPEFARLYLNLLHRYAGIELSRARALATHQRPRQVHFAPLADVPALLPAERRGPARVATKKRGALLF